MKEESVFEQFIREKVENLRLHPSEHVWNAVRHSLNEHYTPRFHKLLILFWGVLFLNIYLPVGRMPSIRYLTDAEISSYFFNNLNPGHQAALKGYKKISENQKQIKSAKKDIASFTNPIFNTAEIQNTAVPLTEIIKKDSSLRAIDFSRETVGIDDAKVNIGGKLNQMRFTGGKSDMINNSDPSFSKIIPYDSEVKNEKDQKFIDKLKQKLKLTDKNNGLQFYFTPSVSYRILYIDNKPYFRNNGRDPESSVSHYPATGLEAGVAIVRSLSKRWRFKGGLQMNFSRYNINASKSNTELVYVSLSQNSGFERNTNIRNGGGILPKKLMNENLQISLPVGMEFMATGNEKLSLNFAGTIQPSISLYAGGYMVTTNYKNYISAENIFRHYNIQTGIECFVKTNLGLIDLQVGPQIRYQLLSNTLGSYPIKEHLIDYGIKIGIVKKIQ
jgi:hypothetical protein